MDTLLKDGQHSPNDRGLPVAISGVEKLLQQALIRLIIPRGSFPYDLELGSRLHQIRSRSNPALEREAASLVQEALRPIRGLQLTGIRCDFPEADTLSVKMELLFNNQTYHREVMI